MRLVAIVTVGACLSLISSPGAFGQVVVNEGTTPQSAYLNGLGNAVRSAGAYNLMTSEAAINAQTARSQYLDNQVKQVDTYFQKKLLNRQYRKELETNKTDYHDWMDFAQKDAPNRLSVGQLDKLNGQIAWPGVLMAPEYDGYRQAMDRLYAEQARQGGGVSTTVYSGIQQVGSEMLDELKSHAKDIAPAAYLQSRKFIESLRYEARYAEGT